MHRSKLGFCLLLLVILLPAIVSASTLSHSLADIQSADHTVYLPLMITSGVEPNDFIGRWINENPSTRSIPLAEIRVSGNLIFVHLWGSCHPTYCDWGEETTGLSDAYDGILSLTWDQGFAFRTQELSLISNGRLRIATHTHYTDDSGREDYDLVEFYLRE